MVEIRINFSQVGSLIFNNFSNMLIFLIPFFQLDLLHNYFVPNFHSVHTVKCSGGDALNWGTVNFSSPRPPKTLLHNTF